ncbi:MAG: ATP-binding protein [Vicingaceae bacterium]
MSANRKELLQLNESLVQERRQLQYYLDTIPSIILILDKEGKIELVNEFACNLYGYKREQMLGKDFLQNFIPKRLIEKSIKMFNEIIDDGFDEDSSYVENWALCKDGSEKLIAWKNTYIFDENGKITGTISTGDNITKQSRIKEQIIFLKELSQLAIETRDINTILIKALESVCAFTNWPLGHIYLPDYDQEKLVAADIWYNEEDTEFSKLKETTLKTTFSKGEGVLGKVWKDQKAIWVNDLSSVDGIKRREEALEYGFKGAYSMPVPLGGKVIAVLEFFFKKSNNERFDLLDEFIDQLQLQLTTIVDRHNFQKELEESKLRAEDANRAKSLFLANMSHEIRTPMNAILGHAQILKRNKNISSDQKTSIVAINKSGNHLLGLINNILNLSKIETGKMELNYSSFNPAELINELGELFKFQINQKGLELLIENTDKLPRLIQADKNKIRQVLINLIANAVKFTNTGSVMINTVVKNATISISVIDTGIGISEKYIESIFETFEQTEDGVNKEGTGLGLSISKKLAQLMNGDIEVESKYGKGSNFTFTLPYVEGEDAGILEEDSHREVDKVKEGQDKLKVLIVDDIAENREVLELLLNSIGFTVKSVHDGNEAVKMVKKWLPNVVLMDMVMPGMNGIEATAKIRSLEEFENVKIIGISASAFDEERDLFLKSGADSFVKKPFKISELLDEIEKCTGIEYTYNDLEKLEDNLIDLKAAKKGIVSLPNSIRVNIEKAVLEGDTEELRSISQKISTTNKELFDLIQSHLDSYDLEGLEELFR